MCGVIDTLGTFAKDSIGEITSHPLQALGAAAGVPGYDPFFGGLFNSGQGGALISPTGNFTTGAWNDMAQANPNDVGALGTMSGVNKIADMVAPAAAGYFAAPALGGAGGMEGTGAGAFTTGLGDTAATTGGLESGLGGAAMFGANAGTGTALGSAAAQGLGAGGLGIAGPSTLEGLTAGAGTYAGALGGGATPYSGTGIGGYQGGAQMPSSAIDTSGGALSPEGGQAMAPGGGATTGSGAPMGFDQAAAMQGGQPAATGASAGPGNITDMFGSSATPSATTGSGAPYGFGGEGGQAANVSPVSSQANGGWANNIGGSGLNLNDVMRLGSTVQNFWQQRQAASQANNYANSIKDIYSPNGAYAQQMQQTLARQDAAAGRNSQGGTRAVQLAAALANSQAQALGGNNYAKAAQNIGTSALNGLFQNFASPQGVASAGRLGSAAFNGLSSLFG